MAHTRRIERFLVAALLAVPLVLAGLLVGRAVQAQGTPNVEASTFVEPYEGPETNPTGVIAVVIPPGVNEQRDFPVPVGEASTTFWVGLYLRNPTAPINRVEFSLLFDQSACLPVTGGTAPWIKCETAPGDNPALYGLATIEERAGTSAWIWRVRGSVAFSQPLRSSAVAIRLRFRAKTPGWCPVYVEKVVPDGLPDWKYKVYRRYAGAAEIDGNLPPCR